MEAAPKHPKRFLVVDDDEIFRGRLVKAIEARGFAALAAKSGDEALKLAPAFGPQAAILDLRMPGMSGLDLVGEMTARFPAIQVVVLTGFGSIATAVEAVRRGAINYLAKPLDADQILAAFGRETEAPPVPDNSPSLARVEWEHIQRILHESGGNISMAARKLGLHRRSLQRKLSKLPPLE